MSAVLSVNNLSKNYGFVRALNGVSFDVPKGSVFGILGPNGSGKTTLLGIVMEVLKSTGGSYSWQGQPGNAEQRRQIGTLLETPNFYHYLSGEKNLNISAAIKQRNTDDIPQVLKTVNLFGRKDSKFSTYSLGMKQRLAIGSALLGNPDILVFDEPTNGLDPAGIAEIRELIKELNRQGKTIIMASHILDEVELKTTGPVSEVLDTAADTAITITVAADNNELLAQEIKNMMGVQSVISSEGVLILQCDINVNPSTINQFCFSKGIILNQLLMKRKTLETRFLEITGGVSDR
jgi:lantibiotic transport system ATP-binding protein